MKFLPRLPTLAALGLGAFSFSVHEWADNQPMWDKIPFLWISGLAAAFVAGNIVQDLYNRKSWLHDIAAWWNHLFKVEFAVKRHMLAEHRWEFVARIRMTKRTRNADFILRVRSLNSGERRQEVYVLVFEKGVEFANDQIKEIIFAHIPIPHPGWTPENRCWGPRGTAVHLIGFAKNVVELEVSTAIRRQIFRVFVGIPQGDDGQDPGKFSIIREDEDVFDLEAKA